MARTVKIVIGIAAAWALLSGFATTQVATHERLDMIDIKTPTYVGYDPASRTYQFTVTGRWVPRCEHTFCWAAPPDG